MPDMDKLPVVVQALMQLCGAGAYIPLVVELFCGGVLGALLRIAQRVVAAQPHAEQENIAEYLFREGLISAVDAFGAAVPQARAYLSAPQQTEQFLRHLLRKQRLTRLHCVRRSLGLPQ